MSTRSWWCVGLGVSALLTLGGCPQQTVTEIILDNRDAGVSIVSGDWQTSDADNGNGSYGPDFLYLYANREEIGRVRFTPTIEKTGFYTVSIYWSAENDRTPAQPVVVHDSNGDTTYTVDLQQNGNRWFELGRHEFTKGTDGYIEFNTNTEADGYCNADAVRLTPV